MTAPEQTIALQLEGVEADNKHVRLDDFLDELRALQDALACIDREINGKQTLYYRITGLQHSSPATVQIEPVLRETYRKAGAKSKYRNSVRLVHHRFFDSLTAIRFQQHKIENTSEETIEAFVELVEGLGKSYSTGSIFNSSAQIPLDVELSESLEKLTKPRFVSHGSVIGNLLSISFARGNKFFIYPQLGPTSVACRFDEALEKKAKACIKRRVRVYGEKLFRPNTGLPFRVNVSRIEELKTPRKFISFGAKRAVHHGPAAHDVIAKERDEWG